MARHPAIAVPLVLAALVLAGNGAGQGATGATGGWKDADPPTGGISGTVTNSQHQPLEGIKVRVLSISPFEQKVVTTNVLGNYDAEGLAAGTWKVEFVAQDGAWAPEYYDDEPTLSAADEVVVTPPATTTGVDASLDRAAQIFGTVTNPDGTPVLAGVSLIVEDGGAFVPLDDAVTDAAGHFSFVGLAPGGYRLHFHTTAGGPYIDQFWHDKGSVPQADPILLGVGDVAGPLNEVLDENLGGAFPNLKRPSISGSGRIGEPLVAEPGAWQVPPENTWFTFTWILDGEAPVVVPGDPPSTFVPDASLLGRTVQVEVVAWHVTIFGSTHLLSSSRPVRSAGVLVREKAMSCLQAPVIKGRPRVGRRLLVTPGAWAAGAVTRRYQWYAGGHRVRGAHGRILRLAPRQLGQRIRVRVSVTAPYYEAGSVLTAHTRPVRP